MFLKLLFSIFIIALVNSEYVDYKNHKVYRVTPETENDVQILVDIEKEFQYLFWTEQVFKVGREVRIQVAPEKVEKFEKYFAEVGIKVSRVVEDVQSLIDEQRQRPAVISRNIRDYAWEYYQTLDEIYDWMDATAAAYPDVASIITIGTTVNNLPIKGLIIDYKKSEKPTFGIMEGGLHAREWISPATTTWIIKEFLTSTDPAVRAMAEDIVWHIFPVTNPDGYVYSFTDNRMWRKNRNPANFTSCAEWNVPDDMSNGIDLNRNFDFLWNTIGASSNPCAQTFAGPRGFSEEESIALSNHINTLKSRGEVLYYLSYHSFTQLLLIPFSHTRGANVLQTPRYADLYEIGIKGMDVLTARHNTPYTVGTSADILYYVSGSGFDWAKGGAEIPMVFMFELRDLGEYGFLLPPHNIIPNNEEVVDGMKEMHRYVKLLGYYRRSSGTFITSSVFITIAALFAMIAFN